MTGNTTEQQSAQRISAIAKQQQEIERMKAALGKAASSDSKIQDAVMQCQHAAQKLDSQLKSAAVKDPVSLESVFPGLKLVRNPDGQITKTADGKPYGYMTTNLVVLWPYSSVERQVHVDPGLTNYIDKYTQTTIAKCSQR